VPWGIVVMAMAMQPCVAFAGAAAATFVALRCGADGMARRGSHGRAASAVPIRGKPEGSVAVPWPCPPLLTLPCVASMAVEW
jgi:hypothetical protein